MFLERKKARRYAMQALYGWIITQNPLNEVETDMFSAHANEKFDREYFHQVLFGVVERLGEIDQLIEPHLTDRNLEELDWIEHTILRIALFEFLACPDIPYRVVINEAIDLTKQFGATDGHKFVNAVLDKVVKDVPNRAIEVNH